MNYCLGTVQFGLNYGIQNNGRPSDEEIFNILDTAINNGITMFDTAAAYGNSETVLGNYFNNRGLNCNKVSVISKISSNTIFQNHGDKGKTILINELTKNVRTSLDNLKIDKLYGLLYHDSASVFDERRIEILEELKKTELVDKIGVSIYTPDEALKALEYNIDIIQVPYNLFDQRLDKIDFFVKAADKEIEVYARSSLLQGLAVMSSNELPKNVLFANDYLIKFENICKKYNINRLNAAVNYVSSNKYVDYIVFGIDNEEQLLEYLSIRNGVLSNEFITEIKKLFYDVPEKLVNPVLWN